MEFSQAMGDIVDSLNNLADWMAPQHQPRDLLNKFNSVYVQPEPYGVVLNIVPWNYPMQIMISSLAGIIAAGGCGYWVWPGVISFFNVLQVTAVFSNHLSLQWLSLI